MRRRSRRRRESGGEACQLLSAVDDSVRRKVQGE